MPSSPVREVTFGTALKISLDHYYDLLKTQVGGWKSEEFLQLKLVADTIDLSKEVKASAGGYVWFSYYNLLNRSDRAVQPTAVSGEVQLGLEALGTFYGQFLRRLRAYVVVKVLTPQEQLAPADLDKTIESLKKEVNALYIQDRKDWKDVADALGYSVGDDSAYIQWSASYGHIRDIEQKTEKIKERTFDKKTILDRQYPTPEDRGIIDAEFDYDNPLMRLRFPIWPDSLYPTGDQFSPTYLALLPLGSTALFDDRRTATWDKKLDVIKTTGAGSFSASLDNSTTTSSSITTDWGGSASGGYAFISVNASASEHKEIQEDFSKGQKLTLSADSAFRINIGFPNWFQPTLFRSKHVTDNPHDFLDFFGPKGTLLYYPSALIVVRKFSVVFESSQQWVYDYKRKFSASAGGGFNAFGISFGGGPSYSSTVHEHEVDKSDTKLTIADDKDTIRFVGYAVMKNNVLEETVAERVDGVRMQGARGLEARGKTK